MTDTETKTNTLSACPPLSEGLGFRLCENCKHLDDSEENWKVCDRQNYPDGYKWNLMCSIQRYYDETNDELCNGKYWEPND